jgi:cysteine synthase A
MSKGNSIERVRMLEALGADVLLVDQVDGQPGQVTGADISAATIVARRVALERGGFYVDQFNAPESVLAHEFGTGPEIWDQTSGQVTAFVACVGSGGTFIGTARALKARNPAIRCIAVEPQGCEKLAGRPIERTRHILQGAGYGSVPPHWDPAVMDSAVAVSDAEASEWRRRLAVQEGLHVGYTAAANVCASVKLAEADGAGGLVVTLLCDSGLKYSA